MKIFCILLLFILIIPNILAVQITLAENYSQGETLQAKVSGNFVSVLTKENIVFYKEHTRMPLEYGIEKIEGEYYIYAVLTGKGEGNYSVAIENAQYNEEDKILSDAISKNFSITKNKAEFSVNPGAVTASEDFVLIVKNVFDTKLALKVRTNLNENDSRKIFLYPSGTSSEASFELNAGEEKEISFKLGSGQPELKTILLEANTTYYEVPVYLPTSLNQNTLTSFSLEPSNFEYNFPTGSTVKKTIYLYNTGSETVRDISLSLSPSLAEFVNLSTDSISQVGANSNYPIELTFSSNLESETEGSLKAEFESTTAYSTLSVRFVNDYNLSEVQTGLSSSLTCSELGGTLCGDEGMKCSVDLINAKEGKCCKGTCNSSSGGGSAGRIVAVIIIIGIIGGVVWFYLKKYKKPKKPVDLIKISKVKEEPAAKE